MAENKTDNKKKDSKPRTAKQVDPNAPKCLVPGCEKPQKTRGLCVTCYAVARDLVKEGKTTWDKLVESNRALARGGVSGSKKAATVKWLLSDAAPCTCNQTAETPAQNG